MTEGHLESQVAAENLAPHIALEEEPLMEVGTSGVLENPPEAYWASLETAEPFFCDNITTLALKTQTS